MLIFHYTRTESPAEPELVTAASMSPGIAGEFISFVLELSILFIRPTELNFFLSRRKRSLNKKAQPVDLSLNTLQRLTLVVQLRH